jgi:hypothetical protein
MTPPNKDFCGAAEARGPFKTLLTKKLAWGGIRFLGPMPLGMNDNHEGLLRRRLKPRSFKTSFP